jgi:hypothetical protein
MLTSCSGGENTVLVFKGTKIEVDIGCCHEEIYLSNLLQR